MEKYKCPIWNNQKITDNQCYLKRDPTIYYDNQRCKLCPEHKKFFLSKIADQPIILSKKLPSKIALEVKPPPIKRRKWRSPVSIKKNLVPTELYKKYPNLERLVEGIPFILNLHSSYWENPKFLQWQLMRLNKVYQEDFEAVFGLYNEILNTDNVKNEDLISALNALQHDYFPPRPDLPIELWIDEFKPETQMFEFKKSELDTHIKFLRACKEGSDPYDNRSLIGFRLRGREEKILLPSPEFFLYTYPMPIDYEVRFPLPYFFEKLPPYNEKKRRPMQWERNLLAYELNRQFNLDEETIVCLLFGIKKTGNYEKIHNETKNIERAIKRIEMSVANSYPLPFPAIPTE